MSSEQPGAMSVYRINEGSFDLPDLGWIDRTLFAFDGVGASGQALGLVLCRVPVPAGRRSLREVVDAHVVEDAKRAPGFAMLAYDEVEWAGLPALDVSARYRNNRVEAYRRHVHTTVRRRDGDLWMLLGGTGAMADRDEVDAHLNRVRTTFCFLDHVLL